VILGPPAEDACLPRDHRRGRPLRDLAHAFRTRLERGLSLGDRVSDPGIPGAALCRSCGVFRFIAPIGNSSSCPASWERHRTVDLFLRSRTDDRLELRALSNSESLFTMPPRLRLPPGTATRREYVALAASRSVAFLVTTQLRFGRTVPGVPVGNVMRSPPRQCWGASNT